MAISKWAGGVVILIAFVVAGKVQASSEKILMAQQNSKSIVEHQLVQK